MLKAKAVSAWESRKQRSPTTEFVAYLRCYELWENALKNLSAEPGNLHATMEKATTDVPFDSVT